MYPPWVQDAFALPQVTPGKTEDEHHPILLLDVVQINQESWAWVKHLKDEKTIRHCTKAYSLSITGTDEDKESLMESLQRTWFQRWNMFELLINGNLHPNWNISHPSVLPRFFPLTCSPLMNTQDSTKVWSSMPCICSVGRNRDLCSRPVIPKFLFCPTNRGQNDALKRF